MPAPAHESRSLCIQVNDVHKSFGEQPVLSGVNLAVPRSELVAIVGNSGCGKSVLLQCIIRHLIPDSGTVQVADFEAPGAPLRDLAELDLDQMDRIRIHWAVVFQRNALFGGTVFENMKLWLHEIKGETDEQVMPKARTALEAVGLVPDEVLDRTRDNLSGGMAKRVAVARALVMDPAILFYDEPTAGLDPEHSSLLHELIAKTHDQRTAQGFQRTSVVITHDTVLLRRIRPRVVMLHHGAVFFDGPYSEFEDSESPEIRPYFEMMPTLHRRHMPSG